MKHENEVRGRSFKRWQEEDFTYACGVAFGRKTSPLFGSPMLYSFSTQQLSLFVLLFFFLSSSSALIDLTPSTSTSLTFSFTTIKKEKKE